MADTTSETFDSSDTVVATTTDPNAGVTHYTYDADGNQTVIEDPNGHYTVNVFDADDRTTEVVDGFYTSNQTVTTTAYDVAPGGTNCSSSVTHATYCTVVTQAEGSGGGALNAVTSYYYDAFDNLIQTTDPGAEVTTNTYDQDNNLATTTTGAGTTTYGYFPNNWLESETFSNTQTGFTAPSSSTSFTYFNDGARKTMVDSTGTTTYGYDPYGRLQSVVDGASNQVTYGYDADGDTTCISYPNSGTNTCQNSTTGATGIVTYGYDTADRMTSLEDWNSKTITFGYDYDSNWNATAYPTTTHATSVAETYGSADNLTGETVTNANLSGGSQSTAWTPDADELFASTQANGGTVDDYGYSTINQVSSLTGSDSYTYDQLGRVTTDTPNGGSATNYGYTSDSALCWSGTGTGGSCSSPPSGSTTYGANAIDERCFSDTSGHSGSCSSPPANTTTTTYGYNQLGELTCLTVAGNATHSCNNPISTKTTTYGYNGDGLRMSDTPARGSLQQFTWDVSGSVPLLLADGTDSYLYGPNGTPVEDMTTSTSTDTYLVSDPTGVRYQFKANGATDGSDTYNPYGQCISCTVKTAFGFEDGYTDNNGLIYLVNRYYDPSTDQFISIDPVVSETGQPFSYANDDPANSSDPSGLCGINTSSVGGFFSSLGSDVNIASSSNCADSWVRVGQENFKAGFNSLTPTEKWIDGGAIVGASAALICIAACEAVGAGLDAAGSLAGGFVADLCLTNPEACLAALVTGEVSLVGLAGETVCSAAAQLTSNPTQKKEWLNAASTFQKVDLAHDLASLFSN